MIELKKQLDIKLNPRTNKVPREGERIVNRRDQKPTTRSQEASKDKYRVNQKQEEEQESIKLMITKWETELM